MPLPTMNANEQWAYDQALLRIEACRRERGAVLYLSRLGLTRVPREIGQLTALTRLELDSNQLTALPPEIGQLTAMQTLYLHNNQLTMLPPEIGQLTALTVLYLHNNQLTVLPPEIRNLQKLELLRLEGNALHGNEALGLPAEVLGLFYEKSGGPNPLAKPREILDYYFQQQAVRAPKVRPASPAAPVFPRAAPLTAKAPPEYDVFVSAKSQDYAHARAADAFLRQAGLRVFFSEQELPKVGKSDFSNAIDTALEGSRHLLVVASSREHVDSRWVQYEWQTFLSELRSGRKDGNVVTLLCGGLKPGALPLGLRQREARPQSDLPGLLPYFRPRA